MVQDKRSQYSTSTLLSPVLCCHQYFQNSLATRSHYSISTLLSPVLCCHQYFRGPLFCAGHFFLVFPCTHYIIRQSSPTEWSIMVPSEHVYCFVIAGRSENRTRFCLVVPNLVSVQGLFWPHWMGVPFESL